MSDAAVNALLSALVAAVAVILGKVFDRRIRRDPDLAQERVLTLQHIIRELEAERTGNAACKERLRVHEIRIGQLETDNASLRTQVDLCLRMLAGRSADDSSGSRASLSEQQATKAGGAK